MNIIIINIILVFKSHVYNVIKEYYFLVFGVIGTMVRQFLAFTLVTKPYKSELTNSHKYEFPSPKDYNIKFCAF